MKTKKEKAPAKKRRISYPDEPGLTIQYEGERSTVSTTEQDSLVIKTRLGPRGEQFAFKIQFNETGKAMITTDDGKFELHGQNTIIASRATRKSKKK